MKHRSPRALILCGFLVLSLTSFRASSQNQTPQRTRLKQNELNQLAKNLAASGLQEYTYRVSINGKAKRPKIVRGFFMMRRPEFMKPLPNGFFDDGQGNLIYLDRFRANFNTDVNYSITFAGTGNVIAAFDTNNDGIADGIIGRDSAAALWSLLNNRSLDALRECFESGALGEVPLCVRGRTSGQSSSGGGRSKGNPRSGTGSGADDRDSVSALIDDLSKPPDCETPNPLGPVRRSLAELEHQIDTHYKNQAANARREASRERENHHDALADALDREATAAEKVLITARELRETEPRTRTEERRLNERYDRAVNDLREAERRVREQRGRLGSPTRGSLSGLSVRPIGPDGVNHDPRCGNRAIQIKQGFWFLSKEACPDRDFLACTERAQDAVGEGTDGRCRLEPGPAGGKVVVCERARDERSEDATVTPPREPDPGPADGRPLPFDINPGVKVNYTFVSTTQLGAMLTVLCQVDGCGPMEGIKKARP